MEQDRKNPPMLPKVCGADVELGNFVLGVERAQGTGDLAARALLREVEGVASGPRLLGGACDCAGCRASRGGGGGQSPGAGFDPQDWGRKYLPANGGCVYIDLDHLELCVPEVVSAWDHLACWHAMLRVAQGALARANEGAPDGVRVQALVNNSDGRGSSYGSHLSFLVTRRAWEDLFSRRMHYLLYLAAFQASSIVYTGQGKVGAENGGPPVAFQLSQRADFFETLVGSQTTYRRPVVNSRDEPLCGRAAEFDPDPSAHARLHVIFFDNTLCHRAGLLKVGVMQIVLAMIEAGRVDPSLMLDDAVEAVRTWSRDPTLRARARLVGGEAVTAVELQLRFLEGAKQFADEGLLEGVVPRAAELLALWEDTLVKLAAGDLAELAPGLDWVLKLSVLRQVMAARPGLTWESPELKHLDHAYSSLDPEEGLYWAYERAGFTERLVAEERVAHFTEHPPEETRAWARAALLRAAVAGEEVEIEDVNWDVLKLRVRDRRGRPRRLRLEMADPLGLNRAVVERAMRGAGTLAALLEALGAEEEQPERVTRPTPLLLPWRAATRW